MRHVRAHGYPVPEVFDASGGDVVMERLVGVTMVDDLAARPWHVDRHADTWADLHRGFAAVPIADLTVESRFGARKASWSRLPPAEHHADARWPDGVRLDERRPRTSGPPTSPWRGSSPPRARSTCRVVRPIAGRLRRRHGRAVRRPLRPRLRRSPSSPPSPVPPGHRNTLPEEATRVRTLASDGGSQSWPSDMYVARTRLAPRMSPTVPSPILFIT